MGDPEVRAYERSKGAWDAAQARVDRMATDIEEVARALRRSPLLLTVSHVPTAASPELRPIGAPVLDARRWPMAADLAVALDSLRDAAFTVRSAWAGLSEEERGRVERAEGALI